MGAKSAVKLRNRGIAFKCNICGRKLMTPEALVAHQRTAHNIVTKRREKLKPASKSIRVPKSRIREENETKSPKETECVKSKENIQMKKNMVEFECPKCFKRFPTYFPALKHIQKYHCVDKQNINVEPNHPSLIQPVRVELCLKCDLKVKSIQTHVCEGSSKEGTEKKLFVCTACEEWFPSLKAFDCHVLSLHADNVESMFFPTSIEFTKWKTEMEQQTNVSYAVLDKYDSKRYYHCSYVKDNQGSITTYFCPSTIVIQEFSKGIQVHYYRQHHKHSYVEYKLSNKYKKYSITSFMKRSDDYDNLAHVQSDDNDLYMQFKTLMEGIVVDAAKINITTLKIILGKALEITSILTNYDEENEDNHPSVRRSNEGMTDTQIAQALEEPLAKRKNNEKVIVSHVKRPKLDGEEDTNADMSSPKIVNSFSLAETETDKTSNIISKENVRDTESGKDIYESVKEKSDDVKDGDPNTAVKDVNGEDTPSSFNDSYKHFVVKNFPNMETISSRTRSKPVVKTRMGQFKPNMSPIAKKVITESTTRTNRSVSIDSGVDNGSNNIEETKEVNKTKLNSKSQVLSKSLDTPKAQAITKSKISRISFDKPKVDYEYEVKEQKDDCNILILKL